MSYSFEDLFKGDTKSHFSITKKIVLVILIGLFFKLGTIFYDIFIGANTLSNSVQDNSLIEVVIDLAFWGIVLEELAFRYFISQNDIRKILISFSFFTSLLIVGIFKGRFIITNVLVLDAIQTGMALVLFGFIWFYFSRFGGWYLSKKINVNVQIILSSFVFGLIHLSNTPSSNEVSSQVLYIIPMVVFGILLAIIRIRFGFIYSIFLHFVFNALGIVSLLLLLIK